MKRYQIQKKVKKYPPRMMQTVEEFDNKVTAWDRFQELANSRTGYYWLIDSDDGHMIAGMVQ